MADYVFSAGTDYTLYSARFQTFYSSGSLSGDLTINDGDPGDSVFSFSETVAYSFASGSSGTNGIFWGTTEIGGVKYPVIYLGGDSIYVVGIQLAQADYPNSSALPVYDRADFPACFLSGSCIATPTGGVAVEDLSIGDEVKTLEGRRVSVKWIGRQTISTLFGTAERLMPVRFAAGSLGDGLPHTDLTVTADHGMLVDGVICHAGALVNGTTITRVPLAEMGESYTVYHIETEEHEIILANGAPAETFIDNVSRRVFDNFAEFEALYGDVPEMEELPYPRAMSARQVPQNIAERLKSRLVALTFPPTSQTEKHRESSPLRIHLTR